MKRILRIAAIVVVLLVAAVVALPFLVDANRFRPKLEAELSQALGREVHFGDLKVSLFSGGATASELTVADDARFSPAPFLKAKSLSIGVKWMPLIFSRQLNITGITVEQPEIALIEAESGEWNAASLGATSTASRKAPAKAEAGEPMALLIDRVSIKDGRISIRSAGSKKPATVLDQVELKLTSFSATSAFPFDFTTRVNQTGKLKLAGKAGPINAGEATATPLEFELEASGLASRDFDGVLGLTAKGSSDGKLVRASGRVQADRLKLVKDGTPSPKPLAVEFTVTHDVKKHTGVLNRGRILVGKAQAALSGTYDSRGEATAFTMKLAGQKMPVPELAAVLPSVGVVLPNGASLEGGTAHVDLLCGGRADAFTASGSFGVENTKLANFDLGTKMKAVAQLAGIQTARDTEIQTFSTTAKVTPALTTIEQLTLVSPAIGELTGAGTMNAGHALDFKMTAKLVSSGGVLAAVSGKGNTTVIPFFIRGTAAEPAFVPDARGIAKDQVKQILNGQPSPAAQAAGGLLKGLFGKKKAN
jgi:AsmA protein